MSYSNVVTKSPGAILHERSEPEGGVQGWT